MHRQSQFLDQYTAIPTSMGCWAFKSSTIVSPKQIQHTGSIAKINCLMPRLVFFDSPFSGLSALTVDEHPVADQSGIDHYPTIPLGSIMLCHSLALVAMNASFIIRVIYLVK